MSDNIEVVEETDETEVADPKERIARMKQRLQRCGAERKEYLDGWQRAKADLINSRRDEEKRLAEWRSRLEDAVILEFLAAMDSFDLALGARHKEHLDSETAKGFLLIRSQFMDVLRRLGVEPISTEGAAFDPLVHEALEEVADASGPAGMVLEELQKGYMRQGTLLRPARVRVSKGVTANSQE